ncbi:gamma-glutamylcyclotransferase family protein [Faecalicoccus acidiformans]|uniref:gamma-glutamylcyclotransferase family protein n=1 Tax=Faecalicoccus acidiformans TaxID=915173 RepID=UPI003208B78C
MTIDPQSAIIYAAYGSNLDLKAMAKRCPDAKRLSKGILKDYKLVFGAKGFLDVVPSQGDRVQVGVYSVSMTNLAALDEYEEYPELYDRIPLMIHTEDLGDVEALVYVMQPYTEQKYPSETYWKTIKRGFEDYGFDVSDLERARDSVM